MPMIKLSSTDRNEVDGSLKLLNSEEKVQFRDDQVELFFGDTNFERGSLFITTERLCWMNKDGGFAFDYPFITMHAVCRDSGSFAFPCVYCQLNVDDDAGFEYDSELRLVPSEATKLEQMFRALSECSALHPDPTEELSDEEEDNIYYNEAEVTAAGSNAEAVSTERSLDEILDHLDNVLIEPTVVDGQFDDADSVCEPDGPPPS